MIKKNFYMSAMTATMEGRPLVRFNTVVGLENGRNVTARHLELIQQSGAEMMNASNVQFDNIILDNVFWLGEMTDEEFMKGTDLAQQIGLTSQEQGVDTQNVQAEEQAEAAPPELPEGEKLQ